MSIFQDVLDRREASKKTSVARAATAEAQSKIALEQAEAAKGKGALAQSKTDLELQQTQQALKIVQSRSVGKELDDSVIKATRYGDPSYMNQAMNANPMLREMVNGRYGIVGVQPLNFDDPSIIQQFKDIGVSDADLANPQIRGALKQNYFGSVLQNGKSQLGNYNNLMDEIQLFTRMGNTEAMEIKTLMDASKDVYKKERGAYYNKMREKSELLGITIEEAAKLEEKTSVEKNIALKTGIKKTYGTSVTEIQDRIVAGDEVNRAEVIDLQANKPENWKLSEDDKKKYKGLETTLKAGYRVLDKMNKAKPEELNLGLYDKNKGTIQSMLSDTTFSELSKEDQAKTIETFKLLGSMGSMLADYIKSISGAAASDLERTFLREVMFGGNWNNLQTLRNTFSQFMENTQSKYEDTFEQTFLNAPLELYRSRKRVHTAKGEVQTVTPEEQDLSAANAALGL